MRVFLYYFTHAFLNQIRKLMKSWILIFFLVCCLIGGLIGMGAAYLDNAAEERSPEIQEEIEEQADFSVEENLKITVPQLTELITGGIILFLLVFYTVSADKGGSRIFLPADVNLLFASPLKPQSILMFRVFSQLGLVVLGCFYLGIQIPNFMSMGATLWGALAGLSAWLLLNLTGCLLQVFIYTVCTTHVSLKKYIRSTVYGLVFFLGISWFLYWKSTDLTALQALSAFFNHPASRWIPLFGWMKGVLMFTLEGSAGKAVVCMTCSILGIVGLIYGIGFLKADFYEDAMAKSQETAEKLEAVQTGKNWVRKKKARSQKIQRDGMGHGWGASVFFYKSLYNRFRFAHFHVFTKTSETYLAAALGTAALCRFVFHVPGMLYVCLTLGVLSFMRAMGNPLEEDTNLDFFRMIPESTFKKIFYSLLGGSVNCFLDLVPGLLASALLLLENPIHSLLWILIIVSVDFYASTTAAFINLSVPAHAGKSLKQMVQIMFIYFGLLPDIGIIAVGFVFEQLITAGIAAALCNVALGFAFMAMLPLFIEPKDGKKPEKATAFQGNLKPARKVFSRLTLSAAVFLLVGAVLQIVGVVLFPKACAHPIGMWFMQFGPIYLVGFPCCYLCLRTVPKAELPQKKLGAGSFIIALFISVFLIISGNLASTVFMGLIQKVFGVMPVNPVEAILNGQSLIPQFVVAAVIAPIVEEVVFRKLLIDRMQPYGEKTAVILTAVLFGLFHGNLSQFLYAFLVGLLFGYLYVRTGKIRYSIAIHMTINTITGVFSGWVLSHIDLNALENLSPLELAQMNSPWLVLLVCYNIFIILSALTGFVLLCANHRKIRFEQAPLELPAGSRFTVPYVNLGMLVIVIISLALTASTFLA